MTFVVRQKIVTGAEQKQNAHPNCFSLAAFWEQQVAVLYVMMVLQPVVSY
jgi:hypothetical protein